MKTEQRGTKYVCAQVQLPCGRGMSGSEIVTKDCENQTKRYQIWQKSIVVCVQKKYSYPGHVRLMTSCNQYEALGILFYSHHGHTSAPALWSLTVAKFSYLYSMMDTWNYDLNSEAHLVPIIKSVC